MLDTAKPYFYLTDTVLDRLADLRALNSIGVKIYGNVFYLKHPYGYENPAVSFNFDKRELCIEASLPKLLQGHNAFGTNNLQSLCLEVAKLIYRQLGLTFTLRERQAIEDHRIRLGRLDTTCSFILPSEVAVSAVLEECWKQFRAEGHSWSSDGSDGFESLYNQKHSERVSDKLYAKYAELLVKRHSIKVSVIGRDRIMELVKRVLRYEVTWRQKELVRIDGNYADQWDRNRVIEVLTKRLKELGFSGTFQGRELHRQPEGVKLNIRDRTFFELWKQGFDLRAGRQYGPLRKARLGMREFGIDLFRHSGSAFDVDLSKLFVIENARFGIPRGFELDC